MSWASNIIIRERDSVTNLSALWTKIMEPQIFFLAFKSLEEDDDDWSFWRGCRALGERSHTAGAISGLGFLAQSSWLQPRGKHGTTQVRLTSPGCSCRRPLPVNATAGTVAPMIGQQARALDSLWTLTLPYEKMLLYRIPSLEGVGSQFICRTFAALAGLLD